MMLFPSTPPIPDWYANLLTKAAPLLTEEEYLEMEIFSPFFMSRIARAEMTVSKMERNIETFVHWLRRKVLWTREHHAEFFRYISRIL
ncbi:MAG: hypothetical protein HGA31_03075 [Candidatus Moranbacteria bacterium]|nr:hypothetical protein [Candidatus Moranbacteria bacterium]